MEDYRSKKIYLMQIKQSKMTDSYKRGMGGESIIYYKRHLIYIYKTTTKTKQNKKKQKKKRYYQFTWICRLVWVFLFTVIIRPFFFLYCSTQGLSNDKFCTKFYISGLLANKYMYKIIGMQRNTVNCVQAKTMISCMNAQPSLHIRLLTDHAVSLNL